MWVGRRATPYAACRPCLEPSPTRAFRCCPPRQAARASNSERNPRGCSPTRRCTSGRSRLRAGNSVMCRDSATCRRWRAWRRVPAGTPRSRQWPGPRLRTAAGSAAVEDRCSQTPAPRGWRGLPGSIRRWPRRSPPGRHPGKKLYRNPGGRVVRAAPQRTAGGSGGFHTLPANAAVARSPAITANAGTVFKKKVSM